MHWPIYPYLDKCYACIADQYRCLIGEDYDEIMMPVAQRFGFKVHLTEGNGPVGRFGNNYWWKWGDVPVPDDRGPNRE